MTSNQPEATIEPTPPPSRARLYTLIATQNQNILFPFLIESNSRLRESITSSTLYDHTEPLPPPYPPLSESDSDVILKTPIHVISADSLDLAEELSRVGKRDVVVLNMANAVTPGGKYLEGTSAQEEALCRRSTLYLTIDKNRKFHPIPNHGAIYSPDVLVIRKSDEEECALLAPDERWWTSMISVAALRRPPLNSNGDDFANRRDSEDTMERIRTLLRVAVYEGQRNLVLGALGCGAFGNPSKAVANLFKLVLQEMEFKGRFEGIWFAILDNDGKQNYKIFKEVLDNIEI